MVQVDFIVSGQVCIFPLQQRKIGIEEYIWKTLRCEGVIMGYEGGKTD